MPNLWNRRKRRFLVACLVFLGSSAGLHPAAVSAQALSFVDDAGERVVITRPPIRVVSLVPAITEIIFRIDAGDAVVGLTYHSTQPPEVSGKRIVGGFFHPAVRQIEALKPEVVFYARLQSALIDEYGGEKPLFICLETDSVADSFETLKLLGKLFRRQKQAAAVIAENQALLDIVARKVARISPDKRRRAMRLMGREQVLTPGVDSFQNEMIRLAGGIAPAFNRKGAVVPVTLSQWKEFNPQFVYGCGEDRAAAQRFFGQPGWGEVAAVQNNAFYSFPCDLTCRAATHSGYFVSWLSAKIYGDLFAEPAYRVLEDQVHTTRDIDLDLSYVSRAVIAAGKIEDFDSKSLIVDLAAPMTVLSTLEGQRGGIRTVGNHYSSPPLWGIGHHRSLAQIRSQVYEVIGRTPPTTSFLFTGADMDNLAVQSETFEAMRVVALVTAGVRGNAQRASRDAGRFYEPGTINILLLTNMKLTTRAMARAVITATEAKTAALQDLDVRSSESPRRYPATGTGTDNVLVVEGAGTPIDNTGGHSKMGELIARAVHRGVQEAVYRQNGMAPGRHVFHRLSERGITIFGLIDKHACGCLPADNTLQWALEELLMESRYADFIHAALALSDDYEAGRAQDLSIFAGTCRMVAGEIAGGPIEDIKNLTAPEDLPAVLELALNALLNGVYYRQPEDERGRNRLGGRLHRHPM